jgi:hypothetical protein
MTRTSSPLICDTRKQKFCFVCADYIFDLKFKCNINDEHRRIYLQVFGLQLVDDKQGFAPTVICQKCVRMLSRCTENLSKRPFNIPAVWRSTTNHPADCYLCSVDLVGANKKKGLVYPTLPTCIRPQTVMNLQPIHQAVVPEASGSDCQPQTQSSSESFSSNSDDDSSFKTVAQALDEGTLNDLVRNMNFTIRQAIEFSKSMKMLERLAQGTKISHLYSRDIRFRSFFETDATTRSVFCCDIE